MMFNLGQLSVWRQERVAFEHFWPVASLELGV